MTGWGRCPCCGGEVPIRSRIGMLGNGRFMRCAHCGRRVKFSALVKAIASTAAGLLFCFGGALALWPLGELDPASFLGVFVLGGALGSALLLPFAVLLPLAEAEE